MEASKIQWWAPKMLAYDYYFTYKLGGKRETNFHLKKKEQSLLKNVFLRELMNTLVTCEAVR